MKRNIILVLVSVLILSCLFVFARTTTTDLGLVKPTWDEENPEYDILVDLNANSDILEAFANDPLEFDTGERLEDRVGAMLGGTETLITVTYDDAGNAINFIVNNDLSLYSNATSAFITNTELAAFTGSINIVTLGTISTGVWQGTAIADAYIPNNITIDLATLATTATTANAGDAAVNFFGAGVSAVTDATTCTDIEGTYLSITTGTLNVSGLQPLDTALTNISALTYVSPSFIKLTADDTYAVRTIAETITDLALDSDDLSDVASIGMLDESENVTGYWEFLEQLLFYQYDDDAYSAYMVFKKKRGTNIVQVGDKLGDIQFRGYDGNVYKLAANIQAKVDGTPGLIDMPGRLEFLTSPDGSATPVLRQAIDNAGNIKMGDGAWTNYVNIDSAGVLTFEGTASINEPMSVFAATTSAELAGVISDETGTGAFVLANSPNINLYNALASDHTYSGLTDSQPVGESVVFGDLLYFNWATVTGIDIAFVDGGVGEDTITQVAAKFLEIGLVAGDVITVSGTTNNNGNHTIVSVVAGTINVATGTLVAEGAGASVTITSPYEWKKAKADVFATAKATRIALETKANGETCLMLVKGYIRDDSAFDFGAARIFLNDDTAGTCDDTAPAESGDQIFVVGEAKSADILFFNPGQDVGEI